MSNSLFFNQIAVVNPAALLKKKLVAFPVNFAKKKIKNTSLHRTPPVAPLEDVNTANNSLQRNRKQNIFVASQILKD